MVEKRRRHRGEGSYYRKCAPTYGCPDPVDVPTSDGKTRRERPEHRKLCRAPWAHAVDLGLIGGHRKRTVVTGRTKAECEARVTALKKKIAHGVTPDQQTVGDWLTHWIDRVSAVRAGTKPSYRSKIEVYLLPGLGHIKLQDLRPEHVEAWHDWMRTLDKSRTGKGRGTGPLSETTIRQAQMILRSALADALTRGHVIRNVAAIVRAPTAADNPHEQLTADQAKATLAAATTARELCRLVCALALGLRQGEALGLRWQDYTIDPTGWHALTVDEGVRHIDGKLVRTDVKSGSSHRRVPIPDAIRPIFAALRAESPAGESYIFPATTGGPSSPRRDWADWKTSLARAGVPPIPLHGARGSAASLLADMGVPDWTIAEILGHASVAVTRKHYIEGTTERHTAALGGLVAALLPGMTPAAPDPWPDALVAQLDGLDPHATLDRLEALGLVSRTAAIGATA